MRRLLYFAPALLALYFLTGVVEVRPGERAVVRRFGRILDEKPEPGLWIGLPWGMDRVDRVEVDRVRQVGIGYLEDETGLPSGQFLTGDHNLVNVRALLYYKVRAVDVGQFVVEGAPRIETVLERLLETSAAEWAASRGVDEVLLTGKVGMRGDVIERVRERLVSYGLGVDVLDARIEQISPPEEVKDAFDSVSRSQTQIATLRYRAEQDSATKARLAEAERFAIDQRAQTYAHTAKLMAQRDATRFRDRLKQYDAAKDRKPEYLHQIWQEERGRLLQKLKDEGRIDLLDHRLGENGLELFTAPGRSR